MHHAVLSRARQTSRSVKSSTVITAREIQSATVITGAPMTDPIAGLMSDRSVTPKPQASVAAKTGVSRIVAGTVSGEKSPMCVATIGAETPHATTAAAR